MKFLRQTILLSAALSLAFTAAAAPARITASVDSTVIEMGSLATVTLNVSDPAHAGAVVDLPEAGTDLDAFDISSIEADTTPGGYTYNIRIQAWYPGMLTLTPFRYAIGDDTVSSDIVTIKVLPVEMDSTQQLNPMEGVVNPPRKWYDYIPDWMPWALLGLLGLALAGVAIWLYIMYKRTGTVLIRRPKPVDPYAEAMAALQTLRQRRLAESGKEKEYYTALIDILRLYLDRRFGINAMEMSSTQIVDSLRSNPETRNDQPRIKQILQLADIVKFAKVRPMPDDNIKSFNIVEQFVESTKPAPVDDAQADGDKAAAKPDTKK